MSEEELIKDQTISCDSYSNPEDKVLFQDAKGFLTVKDHNGYIYSERKGIDSIAFVLFDCDVADHQRIGLINQFQQPINKNLVTAFGGSIDQDRYREDLRILVKEEVLEESGFDVELKDIKCYGRVLVSNQMNQFCYLFSVSVDKNLQGEKTTQNPDELSSEVVWYNLSEILKLEDWKSILIVTKRMVEANSTIVIRPIIPTA